METAYQEAERKAEIARLAYRRAADARETSRDELGRLYRAWTRADERAADEARKTSNRAEINNRGLRAAKETRP